MRQCASSSLEAVGRQGLPKPSLVCQHANLLAWCEDLFNKMSEAYSINSFRGGGVEGPIESYGQEERRFGGCLERSTWTRGH